MMKGRHLGHHVISRRSILQLGLASGVAPLLGAAAPARKKTKPSGHVIIGISQEPTVFNPLLPHIEVDDAIYMSLFSPLWAVDPNGVFLPRLAADIPTIANGGISRDGLTWNVRLRDDVTWHDGRPFTAEDVKFTLDLIRKPGFPANDRSNHEYLREVRVLASNLISWTLSRPYAPYAAILAWTFIVPNHLLTGAGNPFASPFVRAPVGTGPFKWSERVPGDHITLSANENYFGEGPNLERVVYKYIPDQTMLYTQFRTGDIDHISLQGISADHYQEAKKLKDHVIVLAPEATMENFYFNLGRPQFQDPAVRRALYLGMDKESIIDPLYYGLQRPTESYLPPQSWAYNPNLTSHEYNPARAKALLDGAGWKVGMDGIREKNGIRLQFTNSTTAGNQLREEMQQLVQQNWADIGVGMSIRNFPAAVMWGDYWINSHYDTAIVGMDFMTGPDPAASDYFSSKAISARGGAGINTMQYANPRLDELMEQGATALDRERRVGAYKEIQILLRNDLPFLPLFQYIRVEGTKPRLKGYQPNINVRINTWNVNDWRWLS
jgi:peptide/nickel transport system substrate-binding protein